MLSIEQLHGAAPSNPFGKGNGFDAKMRILRACDRSLDDLSVDEICSKAGVSRQTFYRNFSSKYDIFAWHAVEVETLYLAEVGRTLTWSEGYGYHFKLLAQEREHYAAALQYTKGKAFGRDCMPEHRETVIFKTLSDHHHLEITERVAYCVRSYAKIETELANVWVREGLQDPEVFALSMADMVPRLLVDLMDD